MVYSIMQEPSSLCGLAGTTSFHVSLVQQCADLARQFNWKKWLFQVTSVLREVRCPADCVFRVARDEQEPHIWPQQSCFFPQLQSIQLRHHDIADHKVNLAGIVLQNPDRLRAVLRRKYGCSRVSPKTRESNCARLVRPRLRAPFRCRRGSRFPTVASHLLPSVRSLPSEAGKCGTCCPLA